MRYRLHALHVPGADPLRDVQADRLLRCGSCLHSDPQRRGVLANARSAWECAAADFVDWAVFVQDDTTLLDGWRDALEAALGHAPSPVLGISHAGKLGERAVAAGFAYATGLNCVWGFGYAVRTELLPDLVAFCDRARSADPSFGHDDVLVSLFAHVNGTTAACTARAIVTHDVRRRSLLGHPVQANPANWSPSRTILDPGPAFDVPGSFRRAASLRPDQRRLLAALG